MRLVSFLYANLTMEIFYGALKELFLHALGRRNIFLLLNKKFSQYTGAQSENLYFLGSGRSGLYAILKAMNINYGDEVIVQAFTCVVVPNAISYCGATPIYVDIELDTLNIQISKIQQKITKKTKAIIVQHTFGRPANIKKIIDIAKKYNIFVIEDCAAALDSKINGINVGLHGDASFFSMEMSKTLNCGWGGIVIVNSPALKISFDSYFCNIEYGNIWRETRENLQIILSSILYSPYLYRFSRKLIALLVKLGIFVRSINAMERSADMPPEFIKRLGLFKACLALTQLRFIGDSRKKRIQVCKIYSDALEDYRFKSEGDTPYLRFSIFVQDKQKVLSIAKLRNQEIGTWFSSALHPVNDENILNKLGYKLTECPNAELAAKHIINFPTHIRLNLKDLSRILRLIAEISNKGLFISTQNNYFLNKKSYKEEI
jgi:perosamine synthetase